MILPHAVHSIPPYPLSRHGEGEGEGGADNDGEGDGAAALQQLIADISLAERQLESGGAADSDLLRRVCSRIRPEILEII